MQQHAALEQRKARLSVGTAFDPLHFIHESLNHTIAPGHAASIGNSLCIVSQPIDKSDQLGNPDFPGQRLSIAPSAPAPRAGAAGNQSPARA
jgi:hypothetical protein